MEDNVQTIIVAIISIFLLFIFPVYVAYEKKDDISYSLAMRYTQDLVDEVRSKGYITKEMYQDYEDNLKTTGNSYDIQMTHEYNRYDPITNYYKIEGNKYTLVKTTTMEDRQAFEQDIIAKAKESGVLNELSTAADISTYVTNEYDRQGIDKVENTYQVSKEIYTKEHILAVLNSENKLLLNETSEYITCEDTNENCQYAYTMNEADNFNITIKNTNITLATLMYNMVTANTLDANTRIYVNYGGAILASKWYGNVDYAKMKHDDITLNQIDAEKITLIGNTATHFTGTGYDTIDHYWNPTTIKYYAVEFEVLPEDVTELKEKGYIYSAIDYEEYYAGYNFALGKKQYSASNNLLISVGVNGITLMQSDIDGKNLTTILSYPMSINGYTRVMVEFKETYEGSGKFLPTLYVENVNVSQGIILEQIPVPSMVGATYYGNQNSKFSGYIRNLNVYVK